MSDPPPKTSHGPLPAPKQRQLSAVNHRPVPMSSTTITLPSQPPPCRPPVSKKRPLRLQGLAAVQRQALREQRLKATTPRPPIAHAGTCSRARQRTLLGQAFQRAACCPLFTRARARSSLIMRLPSAAASAWWAAHGRRPKGPRRGHACSCAGAGGASQRAAPSQAGRARAARQRPACARSSRRAAPGARRAAVAGAPPRAWPRSTGRPARLPPMRAAPPAPLPRPLTAAHMQIMLSNGPLHV